MQPRDPRLLIWTAAIFATFAVLIVLGSIAARRRIDGIWRIFGIQALTTVWILGAAWAGGWWFVLALAATAVAASYEVTGTIAKLGPAPWRLGVAIASAGYCIAAAIPGAWSPGVVLAFALVLFFQPVFGGPLEGAYLRGAASLMASFYPGLCLAFGVRLAGLGNALGDFAYLYAVLEINDACASLTGRLFGRRPYAPVLSPRKTREGSAGGIVGAVVAGALLSFLLPGLGPPFGALLGLLLGVFGQAADLAASAIKRQAGVKDFAATIPTQGGVLDVYDSLIFCLPPWCLLLQLWRA